MTTITLPRAVVEQALEAMRRAVPTGKITLYEWDKAMAELDAALAMQRLTDAQQEMERSIESLKAALAQQAEPVEPVATVTECEACFTPDVCQLRGTCDYYTASQMRIAAPPQQAEPVYWEVRCTAHPKWMRVDEQQFDEYVSYGWEGQRLYTAPPQRKPLTDEEIERLWYPSAAIAEPGKRRVAFGRAVERAHGIKE